MGRHGVEPCSPDFQSGVITVPTHVPCTTCISCKGPGEFRNLDLSVNSRTLCLWATDPELFNFQGTILLTFFAESACFIYAKKEPLRRGTIPQPPDRQSGALPVVLRSDKRITYPLFVSSNVCCRKCLLYIHNRPFEIGMAGLEPATSWSQIRRSSKLNYIPIIGRAGVEPAVSCSPTAYKAVALTAELPPEK